DAEPAREAARVPAGGRGRSRGAGSAVDAAVVPGVQLFVQTLPLGLRQPPEQREQAREGWGVTRWSVVRRANLLGGDAAAFAARARVRRCVALGIRPETGPLTESACWLPVPRGCHGNLPGRVVFARPPGKVKARGSIPGGGRAPPWEPAAGARAGVAHAEGGEDARRRARGGLGTAATEIWLGQHFTCLHRRRGGVTRCNGDASRVAATKDHSNVRPSTHAGARTGRAIGDSTRMDMAAQAAPTPSFWGVTPGES